MVAIPSGAYFNGHGFNIVHLREHLLLIFGSRVYQQHHSNGRHCSPSLRRTHTMLPARRPSHVSDSCAL